MQKDDLVQKLREDGQQETSPPVYGGEDVPICYHGRRGGRGRNCLICSQLVHSFA